MRIHATIDARTVRRSFREHVKDKRPLTVLDKNLRGVALRVSPKGQRTFFVRAARTLGVAETPLGTAGEMTAAQAREKAAAIIEAARAEREPVLADFAEDFMRRQGRRMKPATRAVLNALPRTGPFVFPSAAGDGPMTHLGHRWHKLRALGGLDDVRLHDCRHTFARHTWASQGIMNGVGLTTVGRLLGHRKRRTT